MEKWMNGWTNIPSREDQGSGFVWLPPRSLMSANGRSQVFHAIRVGGRQDFQVQFPLPFSWCLPRWLEPTGDLKPVWA